MAAERTSTTERLGRAIHSSDLAHRSGRTTDVDMVGALGAAGIHHRHGAAILQMDMTLKPSDVSDAMREALAIVRDVVKRNRWPMPAPKQAREIASQALAHYLNPACPMCSGRGVIYAPQQSVRPCLVCGSSGRKPLRSRNEREVKAVLAAFDRLREGAVSGVNRQLGRPDWA